MIKVFAFDIFNTVFNLERVPDEEISAYGKHIRKKRWSPLKLPDSWAKLPAWSDAKEGIERLKKGYQVVTCSNGPISLQTKLSKHNGIHWDFLIPLELRKVFKPNPLAYAMIPDMMGVLPEEVCMVTANYKFGDLEASDKLGMHQAFINRVDGNAHWIWSTFCDLEHLADRFER